MTLRTSVLLALGLFGCSGSGGDDGLARDAGADTQGTDAVADVPSDGTSPADGGTDVVDAPTVPKETLLWARHGGGAGNDVSHAVAALPGGGAIIAGSYDKPTTFGEGDSTKTDLAFLGEQDVFVAKYGSDGKLAWAKRAAGLFLEEALGVAAFADGTSVVTGRYHGGPVFGEGEKNEIELSPSGNYDVFTAKYNVDGTLAWAKQSTGVLYNVGTAVATFADGSSVVTGAFEGATIFGAGESTQTTLTAPGSVAGATPDEVFIVKYDGKGALAWAKRAGGDGSDFARGIATAPDGSFIVVGSFEGVATFGPGEPKAATLTSVKVTSIYYSKDIFVAKYGKDGTLLWAKRAGGAQNDSAYAVSILPDGSSFVVGAFSKDAVFGAGEPKETTLTASGPTTYTDVFVARYDADGTLAWAKRAGGDKPDVANGVVVLPDGSALVTGYVQAPATFAPGEAKETSLTAIGGEASDPFLARYSGSGTLMWARRLGATGGGFGTAVALGADGLAFVTGSFSGSAKIWVSEPTQIDLVASPPATFSDAFVAKFAP